MSGKKILITGMSGLIGGVVRRHIEANGYELSALNRRDVEGVPTLQADISDSDAIRPAFSGIDTVLHLAASIHGEWDTLRDCNVVGTYNVFEEARNAGVRRVIYASSGSVISGWECEEPYQSLVDGDETADDWEMITHETPLRPSGLYACTKIWGEALARHFSDTSEMSVICLRIGAVNAEDAPQLRRHQSIFCSQQNIATLVQACIEAPSNVHFDIFYGVSNNRLNYRDTMHSRQVLGHEPLGGVGS
ncbi:MAG: NAD(P)-dependent oxidoreductase [Candidatus Latescibacterota bacterium]|nr:NAD(P)-dependent oxidoreductase [Candidatus Latescibacterota bacterium]